MLIKTTMIHCLISQNDNCYKTNKTPDAGEVAEEKECSFTAGWSVN